MRWPLKNQILVRMLLLLALTIAAITLANIRAIISTNRDRQLEQNQKIAQLLTSTRFPLTSSVLENMKSLSGAEFVVVGQSGEVFSQTAAAPIDSALIQLHPDNLSRNAFVNTIRPDGGAYYHSIVRTFSDTVGAPHRYVHIFVPSPTESSIWWAASKSPLLIAAFVLPLACLIGLALASHVTRPLAKLKHQVQRIAEGETIKLAPPTAHDEIHDLNQAVNDMVVKLQDHDQQLRQNERLRTMVQFGNGIAHHLRNSATGCQLAVELLAAENQSIANTENYQVAIRQIGLMNNTIKKFLSLSKSSGEVQQEVTHNVDLQKTLERVIFLLQPSAKHLGVRLTVKDHAQQAFFRMAEDDAEQLMMNLITNAVMAASSMKNPGNASRQDVPPCVTIELFRSPTNHLIFRVSDNWPGPPAELATKIFEPFVTGSPEGIGLGLALVREIADRVQGTVDWRRENHETIFTFEFGLTDRIVDESLEISQ